MAEFLDNLNCYVCARDVLGRNPVQLYVLALIVAGIRKKQDAAQWAVALTATLAVIWPVIYNMLQLLQRWDIANRYVNAPLFYLFGGIVSVREISELLLLLALGYAAIETLRQARRQRTETELETDQLHNPGLCYRAALPCSSNAVPHQGESIMPIASHDS